VRPESDWKKKAGTACIAALLAQSVFDFNFHLPVLSLLLVFFAARVLEPDPEKGVDLPPAFSAAARGICMAGILFSSIALLAQTCAAWGRFNESRKNLEAALAARQWSVRLNPIHPELLDALAPTVQVKKDQPAHNGKIGRTPLRRRGPGRQFAAAD
jgi:hypothetical protein